MTLSDMLKLIDNDSATTKTKPDYMFAVHPFFITHSTGELVSIDNLQGRILLIGISQFALNGVLSEYGFVVDEDTFFAGSTMNEYYDLTIEDFDRMRSIYKKVIGK